MNISNKINTKYYQYLFIKHPQRSPFSAIRDNYLTIVLITPLHISILYHT